MLFNSFSFIVFFPAVVLGYYIIPHRFRYIFLLICSYYFYMCWNPGYALIILCSTATTFLSGILMDGINSSDDEETKKLRRKKLCLAGAFAVNLGILCYFKYANFFLENLSALMSALHLSIKVPTVDVLLPVGISFFTFQSLSYSIDVYRGDISAERNFFKYALFVSFFPQLVAGPIERSGKLLRQFDEVHRFDSKRVLDGLMLILWGMFLKIVIADRIGIFVDRVYIDIETNCGWYLIVASVLFAFQIYCDFAGYSVIAMGAAEILGFRLTDNFNAPYFARSVAEFWRRWHISLFDWFRDYIYIPLGGNRKGTLRKYFNIMVVFFVSGIWHGAAWSFIVWGLLNGLYQVLGDIARPLRNKAVTVLSLDRDSFSHKLFQTVFTFILVDITWVFFRMGGVRNSLWALGNMFTAKNIWVLVDGSMFNFGLDQRNFTLMLISIAVLLMADFFKYKGVVLREFICRQELWFRWLVLIIGVVSVMLFGVWGSGYDETAFIYFQF